MAVYEALNNPKIIQSIITLIIQTSVLVFVLFKYRNNGSLIRNYYAALITTLLIGNIIYSVDYTITPMTYRVPNFWHISVKTLDFIMMAINGYAYMETSIASNWERTRHRWHVKLNFSIMIYYLYVMISNMFFGFIFAYDEYGNLIQGFTYYAAMYTLPFYYVMFGSMYILIKKNYYNKGTRFSALLVIVIVAIFNISSLLGYNAYVNVYFLATLGEMAFFYVIKQYFIRSEQEEKEKRRRQNEKKLIKAYQKKQKETGSDAEQAEKSSYTAFIRHLIIIIILLAASAIIGITIIFKPNEEKTVRPGDITVAVLIGGSALDDSWNQTHYETLVSLSDELGYKLLITDGLTYNSDIEKIINEKIQSDNASIIICPSGLWSEQLVDIAAKYPDVHFFMTNEGISAGNVSSFYGRIYQLQYLTGIIAGNQTQSNKLGFIAGYDNYESRSRINAFALGARYINPNAEVYAIFSDTWSEYDKAMESGERLLTEIPDIDVIATSVNSIAPIDLADAKGIWSIGSSRDYSESYPDSSLTSVSWDFTDYYRREILSCINGEARGKGTLFELSDHVMVLGTINPNAKSGYAYRLKSRTERLENDTFDVFYGPIYDSEGNLRVPDKESLSDIAIREMDWSVKGVTEIE